MVHFEWVEAIFAFDMWCLDVQIAQMCGMCENGIMQDLPTFDGIAAPPDGAQMDSHASHFVSLIRLKPLSD